MHLIRNLVIVKQRKKVQFTINNKIVLLPRLPPQAVMQLIVLVDLPNILYNNNITYLLIGYYQDI